MALASGVKPGCAAVDKAEVLVPESDDVTSPDDPPLQPDGGWGWVVCASCFVANGVVYGTINVFGVLYVRLIEEYGQDDPDISFKTAWVASVCIGLTHLFSLVVGVISDIIGIRKTGCIGAMISLCGVASSAFVHNVMLLYLTFGVLTGIGFSLVLGPQFVILGHYFKRHLSLVCGINIFGGAVFTSVLSLAFPEVLDALGVHKSFLALSVLIALLIPCTLTWRPVLPTRQAPQQLLTVRDDKTELRQQVERFSCRRLVNRDLFRNKNYLLWVIAFAFCMLGYFIPFVHLVKYVNDVFPDENGSVLIMCLAGSAGISRLVFGRLSDYLRINRLRVQRVVLILYGLCTLCIPFASSFNGLLVLMIAQGSVDGVSTCSMAPIVFDLVGEVDMSQAFGLLLSTLAIPITAGPPLAGLLYDKLGTYNVAFHAAGCFPIVGAMVMLIVKNKHQQAYEGIRPSHNKHDDVSKQIPPRPSS